MPVKKHSPLERLMGRLDSLDPVNLTNLVQRLARERAATLAAARAQPEARHRRQARAAEARVTPTSQPAMR